MANELIVGQTFLVQQLAGSSAVTTAAPGGIWDELVPLESSGDGVVSVLFHLQSPGADFIITGGYRLMTEPLYLVAAVGRVLADDLLQPAADALDNALHQADVTLAGRRVTCLREQPWKDVQTDGTTEYRRVGGLYRLEIQ